MQHDVNGVRIAAAVQTDDRRPANTAQLQARAHRGPEEARGAGSEPPCCRGDNERRTGMKIISAALPLSAAVQDLGARSVRIDDHLCGDADRAHGGLIRPLVRRGSDATEAAGDRPHASLPEEATKQQIRRRDPQARPAGGTARLGDQRCRQRRSRRSTTGGTAIRRTSGARWSWSRCCSCS